MNLERPRLLIELCRAQDTQYLLRIATKLNLKLNAFAERPHGRRLEACRYNLAEKREQIRRHLIPGFNQALNPSP
jgi:hypothetical protein